MHDSGLHLLAGFLSVSRKDILILRHCIGHLLWQMLQNTLLQMLSGFIGNHSMGLWVSGWQIWAEFLMSAQAQAPEGGGGSPWSQQAYGACSSPEGSQAQGTDPTTEALFQPPVRPPHQSCPGHSQALAEPSYEMRKIPLHQWEGEVTCQRGRALGEGKVGAANSSSTAINYPSRAHNDLMLSTHPTEGLAPWRSVQTTEPASAHGCLGPQAI